MNKKKVLVGILFLLFLIEITPTIVTNSQTPPSASAYVASITKLGVKGAESLALPGRGWIAPLYLNNLFLSFFQWLGGVIKRSELLFR